MSYTVNFKKGRQHGYLTFDDFDDAFDTADELLGQNFTTEIIDDDTGEEVVQA